LTKSLSASRISSGLIVTSAICVSLSSRCPAAPTDVALLASELKSEFLNSGCDAAVDDIVTDLYANAPDQAGVHHLVDLELSAVLRRESGLQASKLVCCDRTSRGHGRGGIAGLVSNDCRCVAHQRVDATATWLPHQVMQDDQRLRRHLAREQP